MEEADQAQVTLSGITSISPNPLGALPARDVDLTVQNVQLDKIPAGDLEVVVGTAKPVGVSSITKSGPLTYTVRFKAPNDPPEPPVKEYAVALHVRKPKLRVTSTVPLKYP